MRILVAKTTVAYAPPTIENSTVKARSRLCRDRISETLQLTEGPMTDEQKTKFVALQDAWLAVLEKYRRPESVPERDAVITEFVKRGQRLFPPHSVGLDVSDQVYVVVKRLPARDGEFEYQITSLDEPHQRHVVRESQLKPNPWPKHSRRPIAH
jgi:hypothetical protein